MSFTTQNIELYKSLFKGRNDIYAVRWERNGKSGYISTYAIEWSDYDKDKLLGGTLIQYIERIQRSEKPYFEKKYGMTEKGFFIRIGVNLQPKLHWKHCKKENQHHCWQR